MRESHPAARTHVQESRSDMSRDLLTGATGFLGSYLLRDALAAGRDVAVLVRRTREESAQERVQGLLDRFRREGVVPATPPTVIEGDLHRPDLGLDEATRSWIGETCGRVVHCAASITFQAKAGEPYRSNVDGTRYVLDLCRAAGIRDFHLVSTAYVAGRRRGLVREDDLECGQEFSNDYERSKFMSETLVRQAAFLDRWTVYRPSVIVGDSTTGFASSDDGLYAFLRVVGLAAGNTPGEILDRLGLTAEDRLNLVPVDWVSAAIGHLVDRSDPASTTYHLTHPFPVAARQIVEATSGMSGEAPRVPVRAVDDLVEVYRPYLRDHCEFDRHNIERDAPHLTCPRLDAAVLGRLVGFVTEHLFGRVVQAKGRRELALAVVGPEGGCLDLSVPGSSSGIEPEEVDDARVRARCSPETLDGLLGGDMTVEEAIYAGLLALEGDPSGFEHSTNLLESYLTEARSAASFLGAGGGG
jgi:thioester reductase-like protein